jgi:hypothetical protein
MDNKQSSGQSFFLDLNETEYLQYIGMESNEGRKNFSLIFDDENKRVQQVVKKENQRIMQEMRSNGTIQKCPLCLEEIPPIKSYEELKQGGEMMMRCCGVIHCANCTDKSIEFMSRKDNVKCYNCREPLRPSTHWAKTIKPNDQRHWLLRDVADGYMNGTSVLKQNIKKAMQFYKRAADLGNTQAQDQLAFYYFNGYGDSGTTKSLKKAKYYAEKAAYQGAAHSQYILAVLLMETDPDEEVFQLLTLAAFQGHQKARFALGDTHEQMFQYMSSVRDAAWRKELLLGLYWYGKSAEVEKKNPEGRKSLPKVVLHLDLAMTILWHPRDDDNHGPLPGYSHVPFCIWALTKGGQQTPLIYSKSPFDCWKNRCANCDERSEKKNKFKACACCRAFHYCSKRCQVEHWKSGHKVDCKGHWVEEFFPDIRKAQK